MTTENPTEPGERPLLEWLIRQFPDTPKKRGKQWILAGRVRVAGQIIRLPHQLLPDPGATLELLGRHISAIDCGVGGWRIHPRVAVLHLDTSLAVVNKGPGLLAVPAVPGELSALSILADVLLGKLPSRDRSMAGRALPPAYRQLMPLPVHRLDQYTSGVFCMAMNPRARANLIDQLKQHTMSREYVAYVEGRLTEEQGTWRDWITGGKQDLRQTILSAAEARTFKGEMMKAITHYEVIDEFPVPGGKAVITKLRLRLETGRKHQIRVQAAHAGVPLLGDRTYHPKYQKDAPRPPRIDFERQALHAEVLSLDHPDRAGTRLSWTAALPRDLSELEAALRRGRV